MCGTLVHVLHGLLIGPIIIASAYYDWQYLLYGLGGLAIVAHGYYWYSGRNFDTMFKEATATMPDPDRNLYPSGRAKKSSCSSCSSSRTR